MSTLWRIDYRNDATSQSGTVFAVGDTQDDAIANAKVIVGQEFNSCTILKEGDPGFSRIP